MYEKHVEVTGGMYEGGSSTTSEKTGKKIPAQFVELRRQDKSPARVVVLESKLGALFRRDYELCGMPAIRIRPTNSPITFWI